MNTYEKSQAMYDWAGIIAGQSCTRSKSPGKFFDVAAGPLFAKSANGSVVTDVDGNQFIDMLCSLGAISLGHGRTPQIAGELFSLPGESEIFAAEAVLQRIAPWATQVRFLKTGSEATHAAYRVAKRATGRKHILIGDWAYHGWHEWCEKKPDGTPEMETTHLYPHGYNFDALGSCGRFDLAPNQVAAIFIEPHRWEPVDPEWLKSVRSWCDKHGVLLVMDEMIYGGRMALGGATEAYGVRPDLACFGKAIGNGAPVACIVGHETLEAHGQLASGTYSGDVTASKTVLHVLREYETLDAIGRLRNTGMLLRVILNQVASYYGATAPVVQGGWVQHSRLSFAKEELGRVFSGHMADHGVLWYPACVNVCVAHTNDQIQAVGDAAHESLKLMRDEGLL